jgi:indoleacetamide hydrolase
MTYRYSRREVLVGAAATATTAAGGALTACARTGDVAPEDLTELSASAAVAAMKAGDITAETYARALLDRADRLQPLNAFLVLPRETVLEAARAADKARAAGRNLGPLHGLPIPVKDSVNTAAYPTSDGTAALREFRPARDAAVLKPLLEAGAIVMGKTNLHELSLGWTSDNPHFGAVHNPYDTTRVPGGSSGGSGVAVAARMAPLAIAEDTLGSIRVPATMCGICGLRPTYGRYSDDGIMPLTDHKFDQVGPLARTVEDLALFDSVVTGDASPLATSSLSGVRIGVADFFFADIDSEVQRVVDAALDRLRDAGATIVRADVSDDVKAALPVALTINGAEVRSSISAFLASEGTGVSFEDLTAQAGPAVRAVLESPPPSAEVYNEMLAQRAKVAEGIRSFFAEQRLAALAFPPTLIPAQPIGDDGSVTRRGEVLPNTTTMGRNVALSSCASLASLVLPAGLTSAGLPVGLEFDAPSGTDRALLGLGVSLRRALGPIPAPAV